MNRQKNILMTLLAGMSLISCNEFVMHDRAEGYLSVSLQKDDSVQTKSEASLSEDMVFSLNIYDRNNQPVAVVDDHRTLEAEPLALPANTYRIVAASGTLQEAAWDTPFYSGETSFKVLPDKLNNANLTCTVANVAVSVEFDDVFTSNVSDYSVTVDNGAASLTFSAAEGTLDKIAYFGVTGNLNWTLSLKNKDGKAYTTSGTYSEVKARQHYKLKFSVADPDAVVDGAAGFKIIVDDSINPAKEVTANLYFGLTDYPNITINEDYKNSFPAGDETPKVFTAVAQNGISRLLVRQKAEDSSVLNYSMWYDLVEASPLEVEEMNAAGIAASSVAYGATQAVIDVTKYVSGLSMGEYTIEAVVYDIRGQKAELPVQFMIQSGVDAEAYSVEAGATTARIISRWFSNPRPSGLGMEYRLVGASDWTQVSSSALVYDESNKLYSAVITGLSAFAEYEFRPYSDNDKELKVMSFTTVNTVDAVSAQPWGRFSVVTGKWFDVTGRPSGICFEYREYGTTGWIKADVSTIEFNTSDRSFVGEIRGLEPNVTYEFRANSDEADAGRLNVMTFTTESAGTVYNLSFDDWYQDGKVWYPFAEGAQHAWDSANGGAATLIGSSTTPAEGTDVVSGKAVRMESKYAVIAFAAGNLYTGDFGKIDGVGAQLEWGIPFDSRPLALNGYYKYSPKAIDRTGDGMSGYKGQMDKMQIQIFITDWTAPFQINTKNKQFVDYNADYVIAYGKLESDVAYDSYQKFTIPLEYRSLSKKPTYIVISACASYLGDYFTGGEGSVLYVDEFSLEYNPANLTDAERETVNYR